MVRTILTSLLIAALMLTKFSANQCYVNRVPLHMKDNYIEYNAITEVIPA
jgi:hypothetical protein